MELTFPRDFPADGGRVKGPLYSQFYGVIQVRKEVRDEVRQQTKVVRCLERGRK